MKALRFTIPLAASALFVFAGAGGATAMPLNVHTGTFEVTCPEPYGATTAIFNDKSIHKSSWTANGAHGVAKRTVTSVSDITWYVEGGPSVSMPGYSYETVLAQGDGFNSKLVVCQILPFLVNGQFVLSDLDVVFAGLDESFIGRSATYTATVTSWSWLLWRDAVPVGRP